MLRARLLGIVAVPLVASTLTAQDSFETKVQALAHPRYAEREKASRDLLSIGEPALKALRAAATSADPELRARAAAIAERIDRAVRSDRLLVAPKIALKLDKVPLQQAVTEVANKTGLRFQHDPEKDTNLQRPVTLDTGEVPFWQAVQAFYDAAGLVENDMLASESVGSSDERLVRERLVKLRLSRLEEPSGFIRLTDSKSVSATTSRTPAVIDKAIRVRALPTAFHQNKFDGATGEITFHLDVDAAPALTIQEIYGIEVRRAMADGRQLTAAYPSTPLQPVHGAYEQLLIAKQVVVVNGEMVLDGGTGSQTSYPVTLKTGDTRPRQLTTLEGVVVAQIVAPPEELLTISNVFGKDKPEARTADGVALSVQSASDGGSTGQPVVRIRAASNVDSVNEFLNFPVQVKGRVRPFIRIKRLTGEMAVNTPDLQFRDADGKPAKVMSSRIVSVRNDGVTWSQEVEFRLEKPAGGLNNVSLTLSARRPVMVEMPFILKDLLLP
jgi:hypothetical protein